MVTRILTNDCVVCELDDNIPVLRHRWIKKPSGEEFMEGAASHAKGIQQAEARVS